MVITIVLILVVASILMSLAASMGKCPVWVPVLVLGIAVALSVLNIPVK